MYMHAFPPCSSSCFLERLDRISLVSRTYIVIQ